MKYSARVIDVEIDGHPIVTHAMCLTTVLTWAKAMTKFHQAPVEIFETMPIRIQKVEPQPE